jgi:hypothetical protein
MIEYKVQALETGGTADIEKASNDLAKDRWRLVSTAAATDGGTAAHMWLFFEREASHPSMPDEDMARLAAQFATSATR